MKATSEFISIGGNRHPAAADWDDAGRQLLAFGADDGVALWDPQDGRLHGVQAVLSGHTKAVNAVKFYPTQFPDVSILISGSADNTICIWRSYQSKCSAFECVRTIIDHNGPITRIATLQDSAVFATGSSDGTVKIWHLAHNHDFSSIEVKLTQTITLAPRYFPLALALSALDENATVLAVAGTRSIIQIFVSTEDGFQLRATLTGHEGWIRALEFTRETSEGTSDLILASASQDKYIRLWRLHSGEELPTASSALNDPALGGMGKSLSNKPHWFSTPVSKYSVTFEALLLDMKTGSTKLPGGVEGANCSCSPRLRTTRLPYGNLTLALVSGYVLLDSARSVRRKARQALQVAQAASGSGYGRLTATLLCRLVVLAAGENGRTQIQGIFGHNRWPSRAMYARSEV